MAPQRGVEPLFLNCLDPFDLLGVTLSRKVCIFARASLFSVVELLIVPGINIHVHVVIRAVLHISLRRAVATPLISCTLLLKPNRRILLSRASLAA
jgi:hypothetical protein